MRNCAREQEAMSGKMLLHDGRHSRSFLSQRTRAGLPPQSVSGDKLHDLGFDVKCRRVLDGHERSDVVESRGKFLKEMMSVGLSILTMPPPRKHFQLKFHT